MKKTYILLVLVCIVVTLILMWRSHLPPGAKNSGAEPILANQAGQPSDSVLTNPSPANVGSVPGSSNQHNAALMANLLRLRNIDSKKSLDKWRTPIQFFGEVVDQDTNPVAGVQIDFGCNDLSPTGTTVYHAVSDSRGLFSINGIKGMLLNVNVSKAGYYTSKRDSNYFYYAGDQANYVPDVRNPVVFHIRKKTLGESLIITDFPGFAHIAQLRHDGSPVDLDLLKGTQVSAEMGQFQLEFWRNLSDKSARIFDWKLQLSMPNGGIVASDEEFDFEAPKNGYQPSIVIDMPATNQNWQAEIQRKYYIQLANGDYGRIELYLLPRNGVFSIKSAINPSGARNLEPQAP